MIITLSFQVLFQALIFNPHYKVIVPTRWVLLALLKGWGDGHGGVTGLAQGCTTRRYKVRFESWGLSSVPVLWPPCHVAFLSHQWTEQVAYSLHAGPALEWGTPRLDVPSVAGMTRSSKIGTNWILGSPRLVGKKQQAPNQSPQDVTWGQGYFQRQGLFHRDSLLEGG